MAETTENRVDDAATSPYVPSAWTLERAMSAWLQLRDELGEDMELIDDENVIFAALAASDARDPRDLLAALIDATVWSDRRAEEAKAIAAEFAERRQRYEKRTENLRQMIDALMAAIPLRKAAGKLGAVSIGAAPVSLIVTDEQAIPAEWFKVERTLRRLDLRRHIQETGELVPGAQLSNGGETLRLRRLR